MFLVYSSCWKHWPFPIVVNTDISQSNKIAELELIIVLQTRKLGSREKKLFTQSCMLRVDKARRITHRFYLATFPLYGYIMNSSYHPLNNASLTSAPIELHGPGPITSGLQVCFLTSEIRGLDYGNAQCPPL